MRVKYAAVFAIFTMLVCQAFAQEVLTIESTITGSKEQPKVITIIPWQQAEKPGYFGDDIKGLENLRTDLMPLRRESFLRELKYRRDLGD